MKKTFLLLAACIISMLASAQILQVVSVEKLSTASHPDARVAGISPLGDYVLITDGGENGLHRYDLATNKLTTITKAPAAGFNVQISQDGKQLAFSEMVINADRSITHNIHQVNMVESKTQLLANHQADLSNLRLAEANVKNVSLTNFDAIAQIAADENYIKPEDVARLIAFRNNPSDESWIGAKA